MQALDYEKEVPQRDKELFRFHTKVKFINFCSTRNVENTPETFQEYLETELSKTVFVESDGHVYYFIPKRLF